PAKLGGLAQAERRPRRLLFCHTRPVLTALGASRWGSAGHRPVPACRLFDASGRKPPKRIERTPKMARTEKSTTEPNSEPKTRARAKRVVATQDDTPATKPAKPAAKGAGAPKEKAVPVTPEPKSRAKAPTKRAEAAASPEPAKSPKPAKTSRPPKAT